MNTLAIDAGNTRIKWAWHDGSRWQAMGSESPDVFMRNERTAPTTMLAELAARSERAIGCCVAGQEVKAAMASRLAATNIEWVEPQAQSFDVKNGYDDPGQLGADRWVNLIAARHLYPGENCIVASAGTAMTVDALSVDGSHLGGIIVAGLELQRGALAMGTAGVKAAVGVLCDFPHNTADAVHTGALMAMSGAATRMRDNLETRSGKTVRMILTGGGAAALAPLFAPPIEHVEHLLFEGLLWMTRNPH
jgi:type III pantothenate kinase